MMSIELLISDDEKKRLSEHHALITHYGKTIINIEMNGKTKEEVISYLYHVLSNLHIYPEYLSINDRTLEHLYMEAMK